VIGALFVYGSLRAAEQHPMHEVLREHGTSSGPARVRGRLYAIDWYPGLVLDESAGWVVGELWTDVSDEAWPVLDFYEGCSAEDPAPHEFTRVQAQVGTQDGVVQAWVYTYAHPTVGLRKVASGDWLRR
jgi:gamma-glutamylcyclotransferase (GGCT)/AIG2-like uncharacterized protein YtfP